LGLTFERFDNIYGTAVSNLLNASNYPDNPTTTQLIPQFEIPVNASDAYGARVHGYIAAPTTGEYTFWLASDDNGLLRLSSDVNPSNLVDIATVSTWAPSRQWDWRPEQQSAPITLQAGELYYVEALMKEQGGGDNLSVAWQTPGGTRQLIPSQVLCPAVDNGAPPVAVIDANPTLGAAPLTVMLDGTASSDADGPIASYSWQFGDGTTSNAATPGEHIYGTSGTYEVVLTVTDADDRATTTTQTVIVTEPGGSIACHTNGVQYARWNNVWSGNVVDLIVDARYPSSPDETSIFSELVVPTDAGDVYGARMQAYLVAPESGLYTFWVASDNEGQLWLSSDVTTENVAQIAQTSWSPEQGWDFSSSQKSAEIPLIAGQAYYLEGLHQTSWGGDYYAVAWQTPSGTRELIPNSALCVYDVASERTATHEQAPPLIGLGRLSLSPLAQSMPETLYPELALILVADQPLREDAFALRDEFEQMVLSGERLTEEFISELSSLYSRIYTVASPELQAWMSSKWNQIDVEQYESTRANMAWTAANYSSVPTAVGLNQTSAGQTNVWFIVVVLLGLLTTAAFAWRGRRLH
ncbi:MAG: PA14 domain-containing protein, partial [Candidatus Promineifilaceae bacterium]